MKRHTSLNDLSLTRDEQEIEFLRLQVLEQQHVIDDLSLVRPLPPEGEAPCATRCQGRAVGSQGQVRQQSFGDPLCPCDVHIPVAFCQETALVP